MAMGAIQMLPVVIRTLGNGKMVNHMVKVHARRRMYYDLSQRSMEKWQTNNIGHDGL